jgi:ribosome-associated protein
MQVNIRGRDFVSEFRFTASRSSGAGGQNVNKVNTKVELRFSVQDSLLLSDDEKQRILKKLANRINAEGELIITSQTERTQLKNKATCVLKFFEMLEAALKVQKKRTATKPTLASKAKRVEDKKRNAQIKSNRKKVEM